MRNRVLTGALCSILLIVTYVPGALAESPPAEQPLVEAAEPPDDPCEIIDCDDITVVIVDCIDLVNGCQPEPPDPTGDFELCLNVDQSPCDSPDDGIDDKATPPGPGDDDEDEDEDGEGPGGDGEEPGGENPGENPGGENPGPESPGPETPDPQTPGPKTPTPTEPTPDPETTGGSTPVVDIDAPRPGNPNFAG